MRTRADELMKKVPRSRIHALVSLAPEALVRVYSYQSEDAWIVAQQKGFWSGVLREEDDFCPDAYQWMREQMAESIPDYSGDNPVWAWIKRPSTKPKVCRYRGTKGFVRIIALVPRRRILFSDYETWHNVLNNSYLCHTEAEWDAFYAGECSQEIIRGSWKDCLAFDVHSNPETILWRGSSDYFRVQACIDRIYQSEIISVRRF